ncbi:gamma-glutamylcyclotransferase [Sporolituus thermophilus]|uniref:Gamma-glutamylcyclotransferase family protein n=1 Tax=Sporolituus thermophilus DSM 23256 TaxID=1123285 RepID=A0A1G7JUF8_9FIRM|nr:gamma-glutamylcyclotransferase [Sporolituus thermophilus]SDF28576.1 Uncharacterized conserved protein YtfP, gamma-glutamylcyclotransferase (GGCT)/AIG2-like family [Sporolituus thermophilus DSM 23256]
MIKHVFVYGTLMSGLANHHVLKPYIKAIGPAKTAGRVYHLPYGYPAYCADGGQGEVTGELVELKDISKALASLDQLEGYYGPGCADNLYDRIVRPVTAADGRIVDAYIYAWHDRESLAALGVPVPGGDWREYVRHGRADVLQPRYYFAYGSCMDYDGRITADGYRDHFAYLGVACLKGWQFRLNKLAATGQHVYANIEPAPGSGVYGVLYRITDSAEDYLDGREGYPRHYRKEYVQVEMGGKTYYPVLVYVASPEFRVEGAYPVSERYEKELKKVAPRLPEPYRGEFIGKIEKCAKLRGANSFGPH